MLDVSMVLMDPLISDEFDVRREAETVGNNGRVQKTAVQWFREERGVITPQEPSVLDRQDDKQFVPRTIMVQCPFALRDATSGYQPDVVLWNGIEYMVTEAIPWQRMAGFTQALCVSTRATDNAPPPED